MFIRFCVCLNFFPFSSIINEIIPDDQKEPYDMNDVIFSIIDDDDFLEIMRHFAPNLIIGFSSSPHPADRVTTIINAASSRNARFQCDFIVCIKIYLQISFFLIWWLVINKESLLWMFFLYLTSFHSIIYIKRKPTALI